MTVKAILLAAAAAFAGVFAVWSSPAAACSCPQPDRGFLAPEGGRLPSNAKGVTWYGKFRYPTNLSEWFTVEVLEAGRYRELPVRVDPVDGFPGVYVVAPDGHGLRPGATYRFTADRVIQLSRWHVRVEVTVDRESLTEATGLDLIMGPARARTMRAPASMSCSTSLLASQVEIEVAFPEYAQSWRDQLLHRTLVDDSTTWKPGVLCPRLLPGRSWVGVGQDRIYAGCEVPQDIAEFPRWYDRGLWPGRHTVTVQVVLPGTGVALETPARTVRLRCP